jgi:hypothetical protein
MEARLFDDLELSRHTRTAGREHGSFHTQARVMIQALAQTQSRAGRIPVFNYAKGSHGSRNIAASSRGLKAICDQKALSRPQLQPAPMPSADASFGFCCHNLPGKDILAPARDTMRPRQDKNPMAARKPSVKN